MNVLSKYILVTTLSYLLFWDVYSQTSTKPATHKTKTTAKKPALAAPKKDITVALKNLSEKDISIFAGPKEDIKHPKVKVVGGLSKNTLYVKTSDVVCIMTDKNKPVACVDIKYNTTNLEVNASATGISSK